KNRPSIGIIVESEKDSIVYASGYRYVEESIGRSFSPLTLHWSQFQQRLKLLKQTRTTVYACNLFIPGKLKLVGPDHNQQAVLDYVDTVMNRCSIAGIKVVVLGSGEARKVPPGFDSVLARKQFVDVAGKMALLAEKQGIIIAMENLNRSETNFGNSVLDVLAIAKEINRPGFKVTADIYHMLREDESAQSIKTAGNMLVHCHIAEEKDRAYPGKNAEDFYAYFTALRDIGFTGKIMMECGWKDLAIEAPMALKYLQAQLDACYK
ncbi:MAG: sugar phosphate isomerase/epimerase family protein, partial [Chitinophagaceae bacterium]